MTHEKKLTIQCNDLPTLEAMLEKIHHAARAGHLDWNGCQLTAHLRFSSGLTDQTFEPLNALVEAQNRPYGVTCFLGNEQRLDAEETGKDAA